MAGSRFASRKAAALIIACSNGAATVRRVTLFASPLIISIVPLTEIGRTHTLGEFAFLLAVGVVGWGVAVVGFLCLDAALYLGRARQLALDRPWRRVTLLLAFGAIAGMSRAAVLREGGGLIGFPDPLDAPVRMIVGAQVGASWSLIAALIGYVMLRYRSIRVNQIADLTFNMQMTAAVTDDAHREVEFIVARARDDALAAASDLAALGSDVMATRAEMASAVALATTRIRAISHSLEQAPMPVASDVRLRLREMALTTARSVPPSVGSMVGGICPVVVLTIAWTTTRLGFVPTIRSAAVLLLGSAVATLAARQVWHHRPRARVLTTFTLLIALGSLLPSELLLAAAFGHPATTGEWLTRLVLAPVSAVSLLALLAIGGSPQLSQSDWERSVGPRRIEALRRAQLESEARRRTGRILHRGALSRLHAAALTLGLDNTSTARAGRGSMIQVLRQLVADFADELPTPEEASLADEARDWIPVRSACDEAQTHWARFISVDVRIHPSLTRASAPRFISDVVSEAVTNSVRHGGARHVSIDLAREGTALRVTMLDDGTGPISPAGPRSAGQGSRNLDRWAPGRWQRALHPSGGTELTVTTALREGPS